MMTGDRSSHGLLEVACGEARVQTLLGPAVFQKTHSARAKYIGAGGPKAESS